MPRPTSRKKSELSKAVVDLRTFLGDSQQAFSNRLGVALNTVARHETSRPPSGEMLFKLAQLAAKNQQTFPQRDIFFSAYADELGKSRFELTVLPRTKNRPALGIPHGVFEGDEELKAAQRFMLILAAIRSGDSERSAKLIEGLEKLARPFSGLLAMGMQDAFRIAVNRGVE